LFSKGIRGRAVISPLLSRKIRTENAYVSMAWLKWRPVFIFRLLFAAVIAAVIRRQPDRRLSDRDS
jgi:hypothetical protein